MQKYKVFFNEKRIVFTSGSNITFSKPKADIAENTGNTGILEWFQTFADGEKTETVLEHSRPEKLFENFKSAFLIINAAGGVVIRKEKLLFIFRNGKWDLPKGKIETAESPKIAALREVKEECGITGHRIVRQLPSSFHIYRSPYKKTLGKWIFKETFWFEMEYKQGANGNPQREEGITELRWFAKNELEEVLGNTYENLKPIIILYRA